MLYPLIKLHKSRYLGIALFFCLLANCKTAKSQKVEWSVNMITESQFNLTDKKTGWANLLEAGVGIELWKGAKFEAGSISTYKINGPTANDHQFFSNIDAGPNKAFRLIEAGINQEIGKYWSVFAGLRNIDYDHFDTPFTSLFTGSSHGGFPNICENLSMPTYPTAALGVHIEYKPNNHFSFKECVYNGVPDERLSHQFRFRPKSDGLFNIGSATYTLHPEKSYEGRYVLGYALGSFPTEGSKDKSYNYTLWALAEQNLFSVGRSQVGALLQGGIAPAERSTCSSYWGAGFTVGGITKQNGQLGIIVNRALYNYGNETDVELTAHLPVNKYLAIQPALHCITTDGRTVVAGQLRLCIELGN